MSQVQQAHVHTRFNLIPLVGIFIFIALYIVAAIHYPGGSNVNLTEKGFSFLNNTWCDLLDYWSKNGDYNQSRPFALIAMVLVCISLAVLWYSFPRFFIANKNVQKVTQWSGAVAMITAIFVFTKYHDFVINLAGGFGAVAILTTLHGLRQSKQYILVGWGLASLMLCVANYYVFETKHFIGALPILQKLAFLVCLSWFGLIGFRIYQLELKT